MARSETKNHFDPESVVASLGRVLERGILSEDDFNAVIDFGAGFGDSTAILLRIVSRNKIIAVESDPSRARKISERGILPSEQVICGDGIRYLAERAKRDKVTLVTAFGLGPDQSGNLFKELVAACSEALSSEGKLLIESDDGTMKKIIEVCREADYWPEIYGNMDSTLTCVFDREDCLKITHCFSQRTN